MAEADETPPATAETPQPEPAPAPKAEPKPQPPAATDTAIEEWLNEHIRGSVIAQHTPSWNHLITSAIPALKAKLKEL